MPESLLLQAFLWRVVATTMFYYGDGISQVTTATWVLPDVVSDMSDPITYYTPTVHSTYYIQILFTVLLLVYRKYLYITVLC